MVDLPFGSEFSPNQIDLSEVLEICKENEGKRDAVEAAILVRFFFSARARQCRKSEKTGDELPFGLEKLRDYR